ncbi:MAG TPA: DUF3108 domain-containing protein [Puia sp.]|nr:DUF3108 domain-containing protein [Puia sp.]
MRLFVTAFILLLTTLSLPLRAGDEFCGVQNKAFLTGESITYKVFYTLAKVYVGAGEATFTTALEQINGRTVYHVTGDGKTYSFYDNFFKVRDKYESFIDTATMQPLKFLRNVDEGGYKIYENITFNKAVNTAITTKGVFKVPACVQDVISSIYYARNIDFSKMKPNDKIPFTLFLDNQLYDIYIRYLGKEVVKTKYGKFRAIKFKPLLIKGTIFQGGEKMTVWVTDDANHLPIRVESPITVGSIIVDMINFKNRRYPMTSLLDVN